MFNASLFGAKVSGDLMVYGKPVLTFVSFKSSAGSISGSVQPSVHRFSRQNCEHSIRALIIMIELTFPDWSMELESNYNFGTPADKNDFGDLFIDKTND